MGKAFEVFHAGPWTELGQYCFQPRPEMKVDGKLFLSQRVGLNGVEVSLNRFPAGAAMPFFHRHKRNEELYVFVGGEGEMQVGEERFPVREGTVVRVSPSGERIWRNVSDKDLYFICIQYREGTEIEGDIRDGELVRRRPEW